MIERESKFVQKYFFQVEDEMMGEFLNLPCGIYLASDEDLNESPLPTTNSLPVEEPVCICFDFKLGI